MTEATTEWPQELPEFVQYSDATGRPIMWTKVCQSYETAKKYQQDKLRELVGLGHSFTAVSIDGDRDYDTKIYWWKVVIRVNMEVARTIGAA